METRKETKERKIFVGIDVGKRRHEACFLNQRGEVLSNLRFKNDLAGSQRLLRRLKGVGEVTIGLEATGHYWFNLYHYLVEQGFVVKVLNPIQPDSLRSVFIRTGKTDKKDSFLVAELLRIGRYTETQIANERILRLQSLSRLRWELVEMVMGLKHRIVALVDRLFPEYERLFSSVFVKTSRALLKGVATPEEVLKLPLAELTALLKKSSRGRFGQAKAEELKILAEESLGVKLGAETFRFQIRLLLEQIEFMEEQIKEIDQRLAELLEDDRDYQLLKTLPGIGPVLGASILGEIIDIKRFKNPKKLVAYAGLDVVVKESGESGTRLGISKRGSPYLRRAVWMAAQVGRMFDPHLKEDYQRLKSRGKHHQTVIGALARKYVHLIHAILKNQRPYDVNYVWGEPKQESGNSL